MSSPRRTPHSQKGTKVSSNSLPQKQHRHRQLPHPVHRPPLLLPPPHPLPVCRPPSPQRSRNSWPTHPPHRQPMAPRSSRSPAPSRSTASSRLPTWRAPRSTRFLRRYLPRVLGVRVCSPLTTRRSLSWRRSLRRPPGGSCSRRSAPISTLQRRGRRFAVLTLSASARSCCTTPSPTRSSSGSWRTANRSTLSAPYSARAWRPHSHSWASSPRHSCRQVIWCCSLLSRCVDWWRTPATP
mmetsp:Transcript_34042/g.84170  ORF Transcript_34042/g.84170 Transcript_34042/m.84170 type:complete len:239 (-) Transcript_34042:714-1430(-)